MSGPVKFLRLAKRELWLLLEAAGWLTVLSILLKILPFRWIAARCGRLAEATDGLGESAAIASQHRSWVTAVGVAVPRAARHLPWRPVCLPQALAAQLMLRRRGIPATLHLGVALDLEPGQKLSAHAWLTAGDMPVVGQRQRHRFTELARFQPR